ncbi:MAG: response regulator [Anaeromyxobacter sp.]|nr:response regulator [Anaeromyxobacter sp.]
MGGKTKILIVDDDSGIRDTLADCLEGEGYDVAGARNGAEGLEHLSVHRPDLILLDLLMPVMNGHQFLARLRADATTRDIPVLLMTGASGRTTQALPPADAVLPKPFELDELLELVKRLDGRG